MVACVHWLAEVVEPLHIVFTKAACIEKPQHW